MVASHRRAPRPARDPRDIALHKPYIADIEANARETLANVDPMPYFMHYGENVWAGVKGSPRHRDQAAASPVIAKYTGVLAAADIEAFTRPRRSPSCSRCASTRARRAGPPLITA